MDTSHYKTMAHGILTDTSYYETLDNDLKRTSLIKYIIIKYEQCLTTKEIDYLDLQRFEMKGSQFYGLLKVHKCTTIRNECE